MTALSLLEPACLPGVLQIAPMSVRPAPHREPPFDDEAGELQLLRHYPGQLPLPSARPASLEPKPLDPRLPDPARWSRSLLIAIGQIAAGQRSLRQLVSMFSLGVATGLAGDFERQALRGRTHWTSTATVRSVRASHTTPRVAEVSATLLDGGRVRAVALRLEARDGRWRCTTLQLG
jgi:hypothetical protein